MGRHDKKGKKHHDQPKKEERKEMNEEEIDPNDIQPGDIEDEEDRPGFAGFIYSNVFFEWFYRVEWIN